MILSAAFTQYGCVSGRLIWTTRDKANYVITVKRIGSDYDTPKHISFIITNSLYSPKYFRTSWPIFVLVILILIHLHNHLQLHTATCNYTQSFAVIRSQSYTVTHVLSSDSWDKSREKISNFYQQMSLCVGRWVKYFRKEYRLLLTWTRPTL